MTKAWGRIAEIWRYPVSSLTGERVDRVDLDAHGVLHDRLWGLSAASDGAIADPESQKRWRFVPDMRARMTGTAPEISTDGATWFALPSPDADSAASARAGFDVRFAPLALTIAEAGGPALAPRYDRSHLHILSTASLRRLAQFLPPGTDVDVRRFRPNILVETNEASEGFPERDIIGRTIQLGDACVEITEPCERCSFTALAQGDLPFAKEVLHAIARHGGGGFGVLGRVTVPAPLKQGDAVSLM